ncbi:hypothetical protein [Desulfofundulus thermosubterraneus]|nr:hypothetical protein [Desulfofundulus thermosubterraneus]
MAIQAEEKKKIDSAIMEMGNSALQLMQRFLTGRVTRDELIRGITDLQVNNFMARYWSFLTSDAAFVPHWQVLHILLGLSQDIDYQIREHGQATLHEDLKDLALNLMRISQQSNQRNIEHGNRPEPV